MIDETETNSQKCPQCKIGALKLDTSQKILKCNRQPVCFFKKQFEEIKEEVKQQQQQNQQQPIKSLQLYSVSWVQNKYLIELNTSTLEILLKNYKQFGSGLPICVLAAAGKTGSGKSTFLNANILVNDKNINQNAFEVGKDIQTQTQGIWVYPMPIQITNQKQQKFNLFLLDLEGLEGIRMEGNSDAQQQMIQRLYFIGMCLSETCCILTETRFTVNDGQNLKQVWQNIKDFQENLGISAPIISIWPKDVEEFSEKDQNSFFQLLKISSNLEDEVISSVQWIPRKKIPENFKQSSFNIEEINNQSYFRNILQFQQSLTPKKNQGNEEDMRVDDFVRIMNELQKIINSDDYLLHFSHNIEYNLLKTALEIQQQIETQTINKFHGYTIEMSDIIQVSQNEPDKVIYELKGQIERDLDKFQEEIFQQFDKLMAKKINIKKQSIKLLKTDEQIQKFIESEKLRTKGVLYQQLSRVIKNENQKNDLEQQSEKIKINSKFANELSQEELQKLMQWKEKMENSQFHDAFIARLIKQQLLEARKEKEEERENLVEQKIKALNVTQLHYQNKQQYFKEQVYCIYKIYNHTEKGIKLRGNPIQKEGKFIVQPQEKILFFDSFLHIKQPGSWKGSILALNYKINKGVYLSIAHQNPYPGTVFGWFGSPYQRSFSINFHKDKIGYEFPKSDQFKSENLLQCHNDQGYTASMQISNDTHPQSMTITISIEQLKEKKSE